VALGLNDAGVAVGSAEIRPGDSTWHAVIFGSSGPKDLGTLGGRYSDAQDVNGRGQVVGNSELPGGTTHAFRYDGVMHDLGVLNGLYSLAYEINDAGQIVGGTVNGDPKWYHAFLYSDGVMRDLGTLGGPASIAYGINRLGQVVGQASLSNGQSHAFLYTAGAMRDLGTLGNTSSVAWGINASGQVVGAGELVTGILHPFLYSGGVMRDLNSLIPPGSGWQLIWAESINDAGQIVGQGYIDGLAHAFRATPIATGTLP
jgi:probable HAF family extracellular repeat protein